MENKFVLKLIHLVAQCSKITNTVLLLKNLLHIFSAFCRFLLVMSECTKVHFVTLRFISLFPIIIAIYFPYLAYVYSHLVPSKHLGKLDQV